MMANKPQINALCQPAYFTYLQGFVFFEQADGTGNMVILEIYGNSWEFLISGT